jgi:hypothetical protein
MQQLYTMTELLADQVLATTTSQGPQGLRRNKPESG